MNTNPVDHQQTQISPLVKASTMPVQNGLHGVKNIHCSDEGAIYWKNQFLETLQDPEDREHYEYVQELGMHCLHLESLGVPINTRTVYECSKWFCHMKQNDPYKNLLARCPRVWMGKDRILLVFKRSAAEFIGGRWKYTHLPKRKSLDWVNHWSEHGLAQRGYAISSQTENYASDVKVFLEYYQVPCNLLSIMSDALSQGSIES